MRTAVIVGSSFILRYTGFILMPIYQQLVRMEGTVPLSPSVEKESGATRRGVACLDDVVVRMQF